MSPTKDTSYLLQLVIFPHNEINDLMKKFINLEHPDCLLMKIIKTFIEKKLNGDEKLKFYGSEQKTVTIELSYIEQFSSRIKRS